MPAVSLEVVRVWKSKITQLCRLCDELVVCPVEYGYNANNMMVRETSSCAQCGRLLWDWTWDPNGRPYLYPEKPKTKEQLRLF